MHSVHGHLRLVALLVLTIDSTSVPSQVTCWKGLTTGLMVIGIWRHLPTYVALSHLEAHGNSAAIYSLRETSNLLSIYIAVGAYLIQPEYQANPQGTSARHLQEPLSS